jgi:hypothetical protein
MAPVDISPPHPPAVRLFLVGIFPASRSPVPAGFSRVPVIPVLIGLGCVGVIGGGWYTRRWWVCRNNPGRFREYD